MVVIRYMVRGTFYSVPKQGVNPINLCKKHSTFRTMSQQGGKFWKATFKQSLFIPDWGWTFNTTVCQQAPSYLDPPSVKGTLKPKVPLGPCCLPRVPFLSSPEPHSWAVQSLPNTDDQLTTLSKMQELEFGVNTAFSFWRGVGRAASEHKQVYKKGLKQKEKVFQQNKLLSG